MFGSVEVSNVLTTLSFLLCHDCVIYCDGWLKCVDKRQSLIVKILVVVFILKYDI